MSKLERQDGVDGRRKSRLSARRLLPLAVLAAGFAVFFALDLDRFVTVDALRENREQLTGWVESYGWVSGLVFAVVYAVLIALSVPGGALMTITGGFLFGPVAATIYIVFGATVGATAVFLAARYAFADLLKARAGAAVRKMETGFNEHPTSYMLLLRLVPLFPFWLVNVVPAFLGVRLRTYVISTFFGIIPGCFVYSLVGDGAGMVLESGRDLDLWIIFEPRFLAPILGLAVLAILPVAYNKFRSRKSGSH